MASRSYRNNNPGNLRATAWVKGLPGCVGEDDAGFAIFSDWVFGLSAMMRLLRGGSYRHRSIREAIHRYAPKSENDTARYIIFVCRRAGLVQDQVIEALTPDQFMALVSAMVIMEGWRAE
jgi:hypothetical protein